MSWPLLPIRIERCRFGFPVRHGRHFVLMVRRMYPQHFDDSSDDSEDSDDSENRPAIPLPDRERPRDMLQDGDDLPRLIDAPHPLLDTEYPLLLTAWSTTQISLPSSTQDASEGPPLARQSSSGSDLSSYGSNAGLGSQTRTCNGPSLNTGPVLVYELLRHG